MDRKHCRTIIPVLWCTLTVSVAMPVLGVDVGNYVSHSQNANVITINCDGSQKVRITVCTPLIVKVDFDPRGTFASSQDMLSADFTTKTWDPLPQPVVSDKGSSLEIETGKLRVTVQKSPLRIKYYDQLTSALITGDTDNRGMACGGGVKPWVQFSKRSDEHFFGWGMAMAWYWDGNMKKVDKTGLAYDRRYLEAPFMFSTGGYGIFCLFAVPKPNRTTSNAEGVGDNGPGFDLTSNAAFWAQEDHPMDYLSYYFIGGGDYRAVIDGYTQVSGRPAKIGKKWYGIWRDIYLFGGVSPDDMRSIADRWREGKFPMDNVRFDEFYDWGKLGMQNPSGPGWDNGVPDALQYYKSKGYNVGGMTNGFGYDGCCVSRSPADVVLETEEQASIAVDRGFDYAWYDAMNYQLRSEAKQQWEVWKTAHKGDETKAWVARGWYALSSQSFPAAHTGDQLQRTGNWVVFPATLEQHIVGYPVSYTDIGEEHNWNYIGTALRPVASYHQSGAAGGFIGGTFKVYDFRSDLQDLVRKWATLHYRFIPYLFTYGMIATENGMPVWRHMMCHDPQNPATWDKDRQAYVGEEVLISPYYPDGDGDDGTRNGVWIPQGVWYDYFDGKKYTGPTSIDYQVDPGQGELSLKLPMFVKAGAIIPLMPAMQYIGEVPEDPITLAVWPSGSSEFTIYEDETPVKTRITCEDVQGQQTTVDIGPFAGSKYSSAGRSYIVDLHVPTAPLKVGRLGDELAVLDKLGSVSDFESRDQGWFFDEAAGGVCHIKPGGDASAGFQVIASYTGDITAAGPGKITAPAARPVSVRTERGMLCVRIPFHGAHSVRLLDISGKTVAVFSGTGPADYSSAVLAGSGLYIVRISGGGGRSVGKTIAISY
jgi:alpha-glucosidase